MIAVMQIRTRMVHVVVSIVSCASDRGIGVLSQFDFVYLWGVGKYYIVCYSSLEHRRVLP